MACPALSPLPDFVWWNESSWLYAVLFLPPILVYGAFAWIKLQANARAHTDKYTILISGVGLVVVITCLYFTSDTLRASLDALDSWESYALFAIGRTANVDHIACINAMLVVFYPKKIELIQLQDWGNFALALGVIITSIGCISPLWTALDMKLRTDKP